MSQPYGYARTADAGAAGAVARWWLRRRTHRVAAALDEARRAAEVAATRGAPGAPGARAAQERAAAGRRSRRGWGDDTRRSAVPVDPRRPSDVAEATADADRAGPRRA